MNGEWKAVVTKEGLSRIQTVARDGSIQGAVGSLATWGAINVGAWFLLGAENREFLSGLSGNPTGGIYFLLYGGLILGAFMFAFAALGFTTRTSATIFLDGISLLAVGIFNIIHDFVAIGALRPYGYTVEKPSTIWIMLGVCQVVWGFRQFSSFGRIGSWSPAPLAKSEMRQMKKALQQFVGIAEEVGDGIVKASITTKGPLGLDFMSSTTQYTGRLLEDSALMVSGKLNDCFVIDRKAMSNASFSWDGTVKVDAENGTETMAVTAPSAIILKRWGGSPVSSADIKRLEATKTASTSILKPFLQVDDIEVRSATVSALGTSTATDAKDLVIPLLDESIGSVKAAAINACKQMKIDSVQEKVVSLLTTAEPVVRIAAARYLAEFPSETGRTAVETACNQETVPEVKKELTKAQKVLRRKL